MARIRRLRRNIGIGFVALGVVMCLSYLGLVEREREIVRGNCEFNTTFLEAVRTRAAITNEYQQSSDNLLLGFADYFLTLDEQDPQSTRLFRAFKVASDKRRAGLKAHPLPPIPEKAC